jgi:hypothetical protein
MAGLKEFGMGAGFDLAFSSIPIGTRTSHFQSVRQTNNTFLPIGETPAGARHALIFAGSNGQSEWACFRKRWFPTKRNGGNQ